MKETNFPRNQTKKVKLTKTTIDELMSPFCSNHYNKPGSKAFKRLGIRWSMCDDRFN